MSIIRMTGEESTTHIEEGWTVFTNEFEAYAGQFSHFTADDGTVFGNPGKDEARDTTYFIEGWWSSDYEGNNRITQAGIGQTVYFHVKTKNITDINAHITLQLYDSDMGKESKINPDDPIGIVEIESGKAVKDKPVPNNKMVITLTLSDGLVRLIESDVGDEIELYFECVYNSEIIDLPASPDQYLNVEICDKNVVQSFNNKQYGSCDFYRFRYDDFMRRHKHCGHMPPVYYFGEMRELSSWSVVDDIKEWWTPSLTEEMKQVSISVEEIEKEGNKYKPVPSTSYGFKYCIRFTNVLMPKLSPLGKTWLEGSRYDLQKYMEQGVIDKKYIATYDIILLDLLEDNFNDNFKPSIYDRVAYSRNPQKLKEIQQKKIDEYYNDIELDNKRFQEFAFATHPDAYDPKKMQELPLEDLIKIALTPDIKEWFGEGWWITLKQAILVAVNYDLKEIQRIISEFDSEDVKIFLDELWENIFN